MLIGSFSNARVDVLRQERTLIQNMTQIKQIFFL